MSIAYARDYAWLRESQPDLAEAYCLSYIRGLPKAEALRRLGVDERSLRSLPIAEALEAGLCSEGMPPLTAHALCIEGWAVIVEPTGCRATRPEVYRSLSAETELVSVRVVMEQRYEFRWVVDGVLRTCFDARFPLRRRGATPDALAEDMASLGLTTEIDPEEADPGAAALALAERVTGVRVRPGHLAGPLLGAELTGAAPLAAH
ncbi:DUF6461 domain-containing protein [Nocardiopsis ansamitocini]|uniref:Uncharacterized protein n=1 Tax=Nocardiopsis ansamitocini TaxID=1670832 RepID=A0A9W6UHC9_9ACTN|nr:DUF6461 domain-containing protein [Nocardiopsis ansamitocini]GLU46218.1 hypothetical protein Nans01_05690 [Nocardiopsis ansamitocini]